MDQLIADARSKMNKILEVVRNDLSTVRTGRAAPSLVENIVINAYGATQRLKVMELTTITTSDPQTLAVTPFDHSIIGEIQKGILEANLGLNPVIDGQIIRISIPRLSEERRQELIHLMKQKLENGRIMVRQVRHEAMADIKKQQNNKSISEDEAGRMEKEVQKLTDELMEDIEGMGKKKEEELLQI
ncbi:MAG: ribosome recycling factor [Candidatus Levybacteria bacterium RIFCSPLOWO2_01_FULL_38_21]|nr:MAG: ribosome recycling factor [Candidatus Levybacteria bacterium RIFCSPLOWO2_01_FULL_38_21]